MAGRTTQNEANADCLPEGVRRWLRWAKSAKGGGYTSRYIGTMWPTSWFLSTVESSLSAEAKSPERNASPV